MSGDGDLLNPAPQEPAPVADAAPPVVPPADDEPDVLEIPTGEKLVPLSALESSRAKYRETKAALEAATAEAGKSTEKDATIQQLQQQLQQIAPMAQAYQAAIEAQRQQPPPKQEPTPAQTAKLERVARSLDFYKQDGSLDLSRAESHLDLLREEAAEIAQQQVEPFRQQGVSQASDFMLQRALVTPGDDGFQPDPDVLRAVWGRLDKGLTATLEGARVAYAIAKGVKSVPVQGKKVAETIPDPLVIEKAGGKDADPVALRESDRKVARDLGLTDKQYAEQLADMPAGWGKGQ